MKNKLLLGLLIVSAIGTTVVSSCKRGKDDPFLSLRSRKGRMEGEWKVVSMTVNGTNAMGQGISYSYKFEKDGDCEYTMTSGSNTNTNKYKWSFLAKSGDFKNKERITIFDEDQLSGEVYELTELSNDKIVMYYEVKSGSSVDKVITTLEAK